MNNFYFGNLILENKKQAINSLSPDPMSTLNSSDDPVIETGEMSDEQRKANSEKLYNSYLSKVDKPETQLQTLKQQVISNGSLFDDRRKELLTKIDEAIKKKMEAAKALEEGKKTPYDQSVSDLVKTYDDIQRGVFGGLPFIAGNPSLMAMEQTPEQILKSLDTQYRAITARIGKLKGLYNTLLFNPSSLSGLSSIASLDNKFIKVANDKEVISDKESQDYWDKYWSRAENPVPWGTMLWEKPEHSEKTTEEEQKVHKDVIKKFRKVDDNN